MAISATFLADFSDFLGETEKADKKLKGLTETAKGVGPAIDQSITGKAPAALRETGAAAGTAESGLTGLHKSVKQVDQIFAAAGMSLGPIPGALGEVASLATATAGSLGTLGAAAGVAAAAFAGWKLGTWLNEMGGADKVIGDMTAKLLGWGDVAKEEAAAGADALAMATANAGRKITDLNEAIEINTRSAIPYTDQLKTATAEVDKLSAADRRQITAAQDLGIAQGEIMAKYHLSAGALKVLNAETAANEKADRDAAAAAQKHTDEILKKQAAILEVKEATQGWQTILTTLTPKLQEQIRLALEAGVSQGTIQTAYKATAAEVRAVATSLDVQKKAAEEAGKTFEAWAKAQVQASQEAGKLWGDYHELVVAQGGTATDQRIAQIERWKYDTIAAMKEAGTYNEETMTAIEAVHGAKLEGIRLDWDELGRTSKAAVEETAAAAEAMYEYVSTHSDQFTEQQIADRLRERDETRAAVDNWGQHYTETFDQVQAKSQETVRAVTTSWSDAMDAVRRGEGTMTGTIGAPVKPAGMSDAEWQLMQTNPLEWQVKHGYDWAMPGGGLGGAMSKLGGFSSPITQNVTVNTVMGDKYEIAKIVKEALADDWRASGVRG